MTSTNVACGEADRLRNENEALRFELNHDHLTSVLNRRGMRQTVRRWVVDEQATMITVALLDVDHFKAVNDDHGHAAGDELLVHVARAIQAVAPPYGGIAVRTGGDEFAVLAAGSVPIGDEILAAVVGCSISVGTAVGDGFDFTELLRAADTALYASKKMEGSKTTAHHPGLTMPAPRPRRRNRA